jgi:hypothetical protein
MLSSLFSPPFQILGLSEIASAGACPGESREPITARNRLQRFCHVFDTLLSPPFSHQAVSFCLSAHFGHCSSRLIHQSIPTRSTATLSLTRRSMTSGKRETKNLPEKTSFTIEYNRI